jgi:tetratricopeptide (TPR) repeat protein
MTRTLTLAILVLGVAVAGAQPAPQTAEQHYEQSKRYYAINEFDKAIAELKEAYTLSPDPIYLFNIAQAMRKKGDCTGAVEYYQKYLRGVPNAPNKGKVETWIKELEECAKAQPKPIDTKPADDPPTQTPPPTGAKPKTVGMVEPLPLPPSEPRPVARKTSRLRLAGVVTAGAGGALAIGGSVLALSARSIQSDVETRCNSMAGCNWEVERDNDQRGRDRALQSKILIGAGAAAIATGVVLYIVGKPVREAPVAIVPLDSGAMVVVGGRL